MNLHAAKIPFIMMIIAILITTMTTFASEISQETLIDQLIKDLQSVSEENSKKAFNQLFGIGKETVPSLITSIRKVQKESGKVQLLIGALAKIDSHVALQILKEVIGRDEFVTLGSQYFDERFAVCGISVNVSDPWCEALLFNYLKANTLEDAILALSVSRDKKYLELLEARHAEIRRLDPEGLGREDLARAIRWIREGPLPEKKGPNNIQKIRQLIFDYMVIGASQKFQKIVLVVPDLGENKQLFEGYQGRIKYLDRSNNSESSLKKEEDPKVQLEFREVHFNREKTRALTSFGFREGPKAGHGYTFLLEKLQSGWQIIGIWPSWRY